MTASQVAQAAIEICAQLSGVVTGLSMAVLVDVMAEMGSDRSLLTRRAITGSGRITHLERDDPQQNKDQKTQHSVDCLRQKAQQIATHYSQPDPESKERFACRDLRQRPQ
jgi:hypothetical protein